MKININSVIQTNKFNPTLYKNNIDLDKSLNFYTSKDQDVSFPNLSAANFPNITFRAKTDANFLLKQANWLKCAYSGNKMISPSEAQAIYKRLEKRPNTQSACNLLVNYEEYMYDVESKIFDIFKESSHKSKSNFQDVLKSLQPEALVRLQEKQSIIVNKANKDIEKLSPTTREQVEQIKSEALEEIQKSSVVGHNALERRNTLDRIKKIKGDKTDKPRLERIYQIWYQLPVAAKDVDAFIVKYANCSHNTIAKRLISKAVATIEHIKPASQGGDDNLANFLLVSAGYNSERSSMPLDEYITLNQDIDIVHNLQKYMDSIIEEAHRKKSDFSDRSWYPDAMRRAIYSQTHNKIDLDTQKLRLTKVQVRENTYCNRLIEKFNTYTPNSKHK
jgi:hypothetical protein